MNRLLRSKGYRTVGIFSCPGFDNLGPFRLVGGLNKGRPNDADLAAARSFASGLDRNRRRTAPPASARPRRVGPWWTDRHRQAGASVPKTSSVAASW